LQRKGKGFNPCKRHRKGKQLCGRAVRREVKITLPRTTGMATVTKSSVL
jgi:hypothetical protein